MTVFTITRPRQVTATCECTPYVSWVFGAELKSALPFFFSFLPWVITASDCVHNYMTETGDSCMWTRSVCLVGIWCRIKTGASFFSFFFCTTNFFLCGKSVSLLWKCAFSGTIPMPDPGPCWPPQQTIVCLFITTPQCKIWFHHHTTMLALPTLWPERDPHPASQKTTICFSITTQPKAFTSYTCPQPTMHTYCDGNAEY